jgi:hypothetical protein
MIKCFVFAFFAAMTVLPTSVLATGTQTVTSEADLRAAIAPGRSIVLDVDIFLVQTIGIVAVLDVEISGDGLFKVDGQMNVRCFQINSGSEVSMRDLIITNCYEHLYSYAGAIAVHSSILSLTNVVLSGNRADDDEHRSGSGGALFVQFSLVTLTGCALTDNYAPQGAGGAVCAYASALSFTNCNLARNSAGSGGAVSAEWTTLEFSYCTLDSNTADNQGGALLVYNTADQQLASFLTPSAATFCSFSFCTLAGNSAGGRAPAAGGAVAAYRGTLRFSVCALESNSGAGEHMTYQRAR